MTAQSPGRSAGGPRYKSLVVDVDSTLSAVEGIDWLAAQRSEPVRLRVAAITDRAMRGEIALGAVYAARLDAVLPTRDEVAELGRVYVERMEDGAREALTSLMRRGIRIVLVSAGIRDAILPLASALGLTEGDVEAVAVYFNDTGQYAGFDTRSPLTQNGGKAIAVRKLGLLRPILALGDGITDSELKTLDPPAVDAFSAYTGVVEREAVTRVADYVIRRFDQLPGIVTGETTLKQS